MSEAVLPTLRLSSFHEGVSERNAFLAELREVLHGYGFFYLTDHGVAPTLIADVMAATRRFFALPMEEKLKIEMVKSPLWIVASRLCFGPPSRVR